MALKKGDLIVLGSLLIWFIFIFIYAFEVLTNVLMVGNGYNRAVSFNIIPCWSGSLWQQIIS